MEEVTFRTIGSKERLVDRVVNELQKLIVDGRLGPGQKLPPERELAEKIGVSRTALREAVQILVARGLLATKHGVGTVVQPVSNENFVESLSLFLQMHHVSLDDLHRVRSILEVENARLAALQATAEDVGELKQILAQMDKVKDDPRAFADKDAEFHTALARTTHNPLLVILLDTFRDLMQEVRLSVSQYPDLFATIMPDHFRILEHVAEKDVEGSCQAMQAHLNHARNIQEFFLAQKDLGLHPADSQ